MKTMEENSRKRIALILAGCGQKDGSEIQETVLTLLALNQANMQITALAPDIEQHVVFNHLSKQAGDPPRNVLVESARIVRGEIISINNALPQDYDGVVIPGGSGVINNLCDYLEKGIHFTLNPSFEKFIFAIATKKPIVFICIAPILATKIYLNKRPIITIGEDPQIIKQITSLNAKHVICSATEVVVDRANKIISTPANMVAKNITEVYQGITKAIQVMGQLF